MIYFANSVRELVCFDMPSSGIGTRGRKVAFFCEKALSHGPLRSTLKAVLGTGIDWPGEFRGHLNGRHLPQFEAGEGAF